MNKQYLVFALFALVLIGCESSTGPDPSTNILFSIEQPSYVKLEIENSYNTVVATLVDGNMSTGVYSASLNAAALPSGIYFSMLECKGTNSNYYSKTTKKFLLIK